MAAAPSPARKRLLRGPLACADPAASRVWRLTARSPGSHACCAGLVARTDPRSPWQRGSNENTNGLLRQYFPEGMTLSGLTQTSLDAAAASLNSRLRKTLNYDVSQEQLENLLVNPATTQHTPPKGVRSQT